ncbi:calcium-regulated heat stable protein 1-like [Styela clava]
MSDHGNKALHGAGDSAAITINRPRLSEEPSPEHKTPVGSPTQQHLFVVPSPLVTRRERTYSASRRATEGPIKRGTCKYFSRSKGHGFISPADGGDPLFMHISDIEGDYCPLQGDQLSYKLTPSPPKFDKFQAVEVRIIAMDKCTGKTHQRWEDATS